MLWVAGTSVAAITCGSQNQAEPRQTSLGTWYLASVMPEHGGYGDYGRWFAYGYPDAVPGFPAFTALVGIPYPAVLSLFAYSLHSTRAHTNPYHGRCADDYGLCRAVLSSRMRS